jgi:hypothetical protein
MMKLEMKDHKKLLLWAADCAEHVLPFFDAKNKTDDRPWEALEAGRAWAHGFVACDKVRVAASAAHAAARDVNDPAASAAARAAGHAAATAHAAGHAIHAAAYAVKATRYDAHPNQADRVAAEERDWQIEHLPKRLMSVVFP